MDIETLTPLEKVLHAPLLNCVDGTLSSEFLCSSTNILGLYFSASWCNPCKLFTLTLAQMYTNVKSHAEDALEIVFVSKDKTYGQYASYASTMPWKAIPYQDIDLNSNVSLEYGSRSIPHLVFIHLGTRKVIEYNGMSKVRMDPSGQFLLDASRTVTK